MIYIGSTFERLRASLYLRFFSLVIGFFLISQMGFEVLGVLLLLVLLAKLPFYRLHIWLPKVHVEASLLRSVFLAGIILKGGSVLYYLVGIFVPVVIVLGVVSLLIMRSVDGKGIVAISSVLHISVCAFSVFVIWLSGFTHIVVSPLMFLGVYFYYSLSGSRGGWSIGGFLILINLGFPLLGSFFVEVMLSGFVVLLVFLFGYFLAIVFSLHLFNRSLSVEWFVLLIFMSVVVL